MYRIVDNDERDMIYENYTRCELPFRFHKQANGNDEPPFASCPIDVKIENGGIFRAVPQSSYKEPAEYVVESDTYEPYIETLHESEREIMRNVKFLVPMASWTLVQILKADIESDTEPSSGAPAASDGSVKKLSGTYEWTICQKDKTRLVTCWGKAYGFSMTSHRAEAFGMWSLILFIVRIFEYHKEDPTDALSTVDGLR